MRHHVVNRNAVASGGTHDAHVDTTALRLAGPRDCLPRVAEYHNPGLKDATADQFFTYRKTLGATVGLSNRAER